MLKSRDILYPVEKIVDKRIKRGKTEYLVRWKNFSSDTDSWEPANSLQDTCYILIKKFNDKIKNLSNNNNQSNKSSKVYDFLNKCSKIETIENKGSKLLYELNCNKSKDVKQIKKNGINKSFNKSLISEGKEFSKEDCEKTSVTDSFDSLIKRDIKMSKKMILCLESNTIEQPMSQGHKIKSISSDEFSPNSISTICSNQNAKLPSPRAAFNSMLTEKTINRFYEHLKSNELKRKPSASHIENIKKIKIVDKETKFSTSTSNGNHLINGVKKPSDKPNNNITEPLIGKPHVHLNGLNIAEMMLDKQLKRLPYQRYRDSENVESIDGLNSRRKSARQIGGSNRFREIIIRKDIEAGYTEISMYNKSRSFPNCFTFKILNELSAALKLSVNDSSRILLLTSVGNVFSCGLDLESIVNHIPTTYNHLKNSRLSTAQLADPLSHNQYLQDLAESLKRFLLQLLNFPKPIVVGVNGPAIGLGCAILPLCDLIYSTESSSFYLPYTSLSQFPEGGTSVTLSMLIGMPAANQLLLGGRRWSAREALARGLISEVIFSEKFKVELFSRCKKLANISSMSMETMKCMLRFQYKEKIELSINLECKKLLDIWRTKEFQNSAQHFLDKELPDLLS